MIDLYLASTSIWICIGIAPIYCFIFIFSMRAFGAEIVAYVSVALVEFYLILASTSCYMFRYLQKVDFDNNTAALNKVKDEKGEDITKEMASLQETFDSNRKLFNWGIIGFAFIACIFGGCCLILG